MIIDSYETNQFWSVYVRICWNHLESSNSRISRFLGSPKKTTKTKKQTSQEGSRYIYDHLVLEIIGALDLHW